MHKNRTGWVQKVARQQARRHGRSIVRPITRCFTSFHPSLHLLNWDFVPSVSINENEAAADVTAFVSYRNRASRADDDERGMRASQSRLVSLMTPAGLTNRNLRRSAHWDDKRAFSTYGGQRTLDQDPGRVCTTVAAGGIIENRAAR